MYVPRTSSIIYWNLIGIPVIVYVSLTVTSDDSNADCVTATHSENGEVEDSELRLIVQDEEDFEDFVAAVEYTELENKFLEEGCKCVLNCVRNFSRDTILESRRSSIAANYYCKDRHVNHQNLLLRGVFNVLCRDGPTTTKKDHAGKERMKSHTEYQFRGKLVCRQFFTFAFGVGVKKLKNEKRRFLMYGMEEVQHGNTGVPVQHIASEGCARVIKFITAFSEQNSLVLPGRLPTYRLHKDLHLLPCTMNKSFLYSQYMAACGENNWESVSRPTWYRLWLEHCGNIVVQKPKTDMCAVCQRLVISLGRMQGLSETEKAERINEASTHLKKVQMERKYYHDVIAECAQTIPELFYYVPPHCPLSYASTMHYSFDFAQTISIPYSSQQVGPLYFLSGYKIALFAVVIEPMKKCVLYLIPEACYTGKGCNLVISLLEHFFENFGLGEEHCKCHADNCAAQNKNNYLFQYFASRVKRGLHRACDIDFLPVGHTKFGPDAYLGVFKSKFRKSECYSVRDVLRVATSSFPHSNAATVVLVGNSRGDIHVPTFDWMQWFNANGAQTIPKVLSYQHFSMRADDPGAILCSTQLDSEQVRFEILPSTFDVSTSPPTIEPTKLTYKRRKYLHEKFTPYIPESYKSKYLWKKPKVGREEASDAIRVRSRTRLSAKQSTSRSQSVKLKRVSPANTASTSRQPAKHCPPAACTSTLSKRTRTRVMSRSEY